MEKITLVGLRFFTNKPLFYEGKEYDGGEIVGEPEDSVYELSINKKGTVIGKMKLQFPNEFNQSEWIFYLPGESRLN